VAGPVLPARSPPGLLDQARHPIRQGLLLGGGQVRPAVAALEGVAFGPHGDVVGRHRRAAKSVTDGR